ncbi:MAG: hypothetical protein P8123_04790, partial [bacterium]
MCALIYVPSLQCSRRKRINGKYYFKIADETGFSFLNDNIPKKLYCDPIQEISYPAILPNEIMAITDPIDALKTTLKSTEFPELTKFINTLEAIGIPVDAIGLFGSVMLGFTDKPVNDFDLVIYGHHNRRRYLDSFDDLIYKYCYERIPEIEIRKSARSVGLKNMPIGYNRAYSISLNRHSYSLKYNECYFSVKFAYDLSETCQSERLRPAQEVYLRGVVSNDDGVYCLPYRFEVYADGRHYEIYTYSFSFFCAAFKGTKVEVLGCLRKHPCRSIDRFIGKPQHHRAK